jgi:anti-sigma factor ChrR (cupin superfamily)
MLPWTGNEPRPPVLTSVSNSSLPSVSSFSRVELPKLLWIAEHPDEISWQPFRPGVEIHRLYGDGLDGPSAALLRFAPGGVVPLHEHTGYEHILVLAGSQHDANSTATAGTLMINPPGTQHRIVSETGCIVLAIYERPVRFLESDPDVNSG